MFKSTKLIFKYSIKNLWEIINGLKRDINTQKVLDIKLVFVKDIILFIQPVNQPIFYKFLFRY